jgi:hypothetical protein
VQTILIKDGDHRLSRGQDLALLTATLASMLDALMILSLPCSPSPRPTARRAAAGDEEGRAADCQAAVAAIRKRARQRQSLARGGGGLHARQCIGLAYVQLEQWQQAATTFEQAAQEADRASDARGTDFWVQAATPGSRPARCRAPSRRSILH